MARIFRTTARLNPIKAITRNAGQEASAAPGVKKRTPEELAEYAKREMEDVRFQFRKTIQLCDIFQFDSCLELGEPWFASIRQEEGQEERTVGLHGHGRHPGGASVGVVL